MNISNIADRFWSWANYAYDAYRNHHAGDELSCRPFDGITPHAIHPIATALLALQEPLLETETRYKVAIALLFHDLFEDSTKGLPNDLPPEWVDEITQIVKEMTYENGLPQEVVELWQKSPLTILAKLFDKYHSLTEHAAWMPHHRPIEGRLFLDHSRKVAAYVEKHFGRLHIVSATQQLCDRYDANFPVAPQNFEQQLEEVREEIRKR